MGAAAVAGSPWGQWLGPCMCKATHTPPIAWHYMYQSLEAPKCKLHVGFTWVSKLGAPKGGPNLGPTWAPREVYILCGGFSTTNARVFCGAPRVVPLYIYGHHGPLKGAAAQVLRVGHHELHLATHGLLHHLQGWHGRPQLPWGAMVGLCVGVGPTWGPQFMAQPLMVVVLCAGVGPTWGLHVGGTKGNGKPNGALGAWRASPPTPGGFNI